MPLPDTKKIQFDLGNTVDSNWYEAILVGHIEKNNENILSSHIEFCLIENKKRVWAVLPHDQDSLQKIKRLKQALGMADEESELQPYYNKQLLIYIDRKFRDGKALNDVIDFEQTKSSSQTHKHEPNIINGRKVPKEILIVDDQEEIAQLVGNYIEQIGFIPDIVSTVDEAINRFDPEKYMMVISDVIMPGKNGFDLVRHLHNKHPKVYVALVSGYFDKEMENLQQLFGIDKIYKKPVFFNSVKEMVAAALQKINLETAEAS